MPANPKQQANHPSELVTSIQKKQKEAALKSLLTGGDPRPVLIFLAGCNGAGKSSLMAEISRLMMLQPIFLNADMIARIIAGIPAPDEAAQKLTESLREHMLSQGTTFVTETVFSDEVGAKLAYLRRAEQAGFRVVLIYVSLSSVGLSKQRVLYRVNAEKGHNVDPSKLSRRYLASHENARRALLFVEHGVVYDNSSREEPYRLVAITADGLVAQKFGVAPPQIEKILPPAQKPEADDDVAGMAD